jgi:hypothetical protein
MTLRLAPKRFDALRVTRDWMSLSGTQSVEAIVPRVRQRIWKSWFVPGAFLHCHWSNC